MCLNGRWRGFASATKRMVMSMTDPGRADRARQLLQTTAFWSDCQKPGLCQLPHSSRRSGHQWRLFHEELYVGFLLAMVSTVVLLPRTLTAWQKVVKNRFFRWIISWAPSQAPPILSKTLRGSSGSTVYPEDSQIWRWNDYGLGLHPIRRCQGDL